MKKYEKDTIVAQATPAGRGGIGVVRVSGAREKITFIAEKILGQLPSPRVATHSPFFDHDHSAIDVGIAIYFPSPHSFTGEDVLEFQGHGGPMIMMILIERIVALGARIARPGEFSERAFLNDKIDLTQAEAIADAINSDSTQAARLAIRSLQGEFSKEIHLLVEELIQLRAYVEASIDFPDEDIEFLTQGKVRQRSQMVADHIEKILEQAKQGAIFREGITIVIAGKPNVGKSSLLNQLTGKDSAIVTHMAGTTRDVMREYIQLDGIPLHIVDTAGLRPSADIVEQEGIRRAKKEIEMADHVLLLVDSRDTISTDIHQIISDIAENISSELHNLFHKTSFTLVRNKIDLSKEKAQIQQQNDFFIISLSAKTGEGINLLREHLKEQSGINTTIENNFIARTRHIDALRRAHQFLLQGIKQLAAYQAGDLLAEDLRQAQHALSEITGQFTADDLLGKIFSEFCVGK